MQTCVKDSAIWFDRCKPCVPSIGQPRNVASFAGHYEFKKCVRLQPFPYKDYNNTINRLVNTSLDFYGGVVREQLETPASSERTMIQQIRQMNVNAYAHAVTQGCAPGVGQISNTYGLAQRHA